MAQGTLWLQPIQRFWANNGLSVLPGCKAFFYLAGTTTPVSVYADVGLTTPLTQPVVADGNGIFVEIFLTPGTAYKVDVQTSGGVSLPGYPADSQLAIPASSATVDTTETAGEAITAGQVVYISDGSGGKTVGQLYKGDNGNAYSSTLPPIGISPSAISAGATGAFRTAGQVTGLAGLTPGTDYFVGAAGALTSTAPTNARYVGRADSASSIIVNANPRPYVNGTANGVLLSAGPGLLPISTAVLTNGQLLIGNTGTAPSLATLTAGEGLQIANAAGAITLSNGVLDHKTSTTTVNNNAGETTLYTFAVLGGTLGTNRILHFSAAGTLQQNSGASDKTYTFRAKYGATTFAAFTIQNVPTANATGPVTIECEIMATGATNSQVGRALLSLGYSSSTFNNAGVSQVDMSATNIVQQMLTVTADHTTMAIDSTASQNFVITGQMSAANASMTITMNSAYLEVK